MPYQDGKYVAPTWSNNAPPPINASELQAIADKCEDTWDKDETISAYTAAIYGLSADYTPDKAFRAISTNFNRVINVTVTLDGSPIEGVTVLGITPLSGEGNCVTNSSGKTSGTTGVDTVTISTEEFMDVVGGKASKVVETGGALLTDTTLEMTSVSTFKKQYISSTTLKLVRNSVNYFIVGGGGSGGCSVGSNRYRTGAVGGAGGYTKTGNINISNKTLSLSVGAGGSSVSLTYGQGYSSNGKAGGATTITSGGVTVSANGGGQGGATSNMAAIRVKGSNGGSGSGAIYADDSKVDVGNPGTNGGNGGNANYNSTVGGSGQGTTTQFDSIMYSSAGGSAAAANGNNHMTSGNGVFGTSGGNGSQYGDGGGACINTSGTVTSGAGKQGCVWIYW